MSQFLARQDIVINIVLIPDMEGDLPCLFYVFLI